MILAGILGLALLLVTTGCRRRPTETLGEFVEKTESGQKARVLLDLYLTESPPPPEGLALASSVSVLAPPGWLDRYVPVDLARDHLAGDVPLFVRTGPDDYRAVERAEARQLAAGERVYVYWRAPALERFERDYGIRIELGNVTNEELTFTGVRTERSQQFDLVFGPRTILPMLLNQEHLAPFSADALTRASQPFRYIAEVLAHRPADVDLEFCLPYSWRPVGIGYNENMVSGSPEQWSEAMEFERNERFWDRVWLRRDPFILLGLGVLYRDRMPSVQRAAEVQSTSELIAAVEALAAGDMAPEHKAAALRELRHRYAKPAIDEREGRKFGIHSADFTTADSERFQFQRLKHMVTNRVEQSRFHEEQDVRDAANLLKRLLVFGADFSLGSGIPLDVENEDWVFDLGSSGDPFAGMRVHSTYDFSIPTANAPLELDVFILPDSRSELSRRTAQFLVDYLLIPEVAASMTAFNLKATFVRDAVAFLPVEITNSSVYALPSLEDVVFLPIIEEDVDHLRLHWRGVLEFRELVRSIDGNFGASPHATGPRQESPL